MAPTLEDKVALAAMAAAEFGHFGPLQRRICGAGDRPVLAMAPFRKPIDEFHAHTAPSDWLESLIKAYVGDGLAADFYREIAAYLDTDTRDLIIASLADAGHSEFVVDRVRAAIAADGRLGGRLALWGRRLMGEALSQAQRVAAERDALAALLAGGVDRPGLDLAAIGRMFGRLTERHAERMSAPRPGLLSLEVSSARDGTGPRTCRCGARSGSVVAASSLGSQRTLLRERPVTVEAIMTSTTAVAIVTKPWVQSRPRLPSPPKAR